MIRAVDPSFSFDAVARRLARHQLVKLMVALMRFTDPDDENAARASAGQPPERWLSRLVQLGVLSPRELVDPWGNPFAFRRAATPRVVITARAPNWELVSPGPDGRVGTRDDVRDPFTRIVPQGTPYAVASGEDTLMKQLSTLAPGPRVLQGMAQAYSTVSLAAREEQRARTVTATGSEMDQTLGGLALNGSGRGGGGTGEGTIGLGNLGSVGYGRGAGRAAPSRRSRASADAPAPEPMEMEEAAAEDMDDGVRRERNAQQPAPPPSTFGTLRDVVRERFPATLHFVGLVPLDGTQTMAELPLADALTTYRVEAIAWSASGWLTTAQTEVRVDQEATIDAPVPPFATVGDALRLPVRVANRTAQPLEAKVVVEAEGLELALPEAPRVTVPPRDAVEVIVPVTLRQVGEGHLLVRVLRASDDGPLDAVRRPLVVWPDARLVRERRERLLEPGEGAAELRFDVPADATERGPGELRIVPGAALFGDVAAYGGAQPLAGWALALQGQSIPEEVLQRSRALLRAGDPDESRDLYGNPLQIAQAVSTTWRDATVDPLALRRGLRSVSRILGSPESTSPDPNRTLLYANVLAALAPAQRAASERPAVEHVLEDLFAQLRTRAGDGAARVSEQPTVSANAAFALALAGDPGRARELMRRAERGVVRLEDQAFLEPAAQAGELLARIGPTAHMAAAWAALGEPARGLPYLRDLVALSPAVERWPTEARLLASVAGGLVGGGGA
ncbi:MAG TPA: alpha-2-macroglobulin family protein, partial [Polyangiaceae bacterium LLY-WYZ-15_(1-7)]|nr:alpha-2-macroglobulin family protein [Polyangiaceae bacterium LLY-WYZ-15_(1-7)]